MIKVVPFEELIFSSWHITTQLCISSMLIAGSKHASKNCFDISLVKGVYEHDGLSFVVCLRGFQAVRAILETMISSVPQFGNIILLLFIVIFPC
jgi:hypothetical protein